MGAFTRRFFAFILSILILFILLANNAYASVTPSFGSTQPSGSKVADSNCPGYAGYTCNNGPSISDSGGCEAACNDASTNPWEKHDYSGCYAIAPDEYSAWIPSTGAVCSTADKYNDRYGDNDLTRLRYGDCSCTTQDIYKTCCGGSPAHPIDTYNFTSSSGQGNPAWPDGACAGTTVQCGYTGVPNCGQPACNTLGTPTPPTPTPSTFVCPNGSCTSAQAGTSCNGLTAKRTCSFDVNANDYCWSANQSCNTGETCVSGVCTANTCPAGKSPCTQEGKYECVGANAHAICQQYPSANNPDVTILCYDIINTTSCPAGQTCNVNSGNCQPGNPPTPTPTSAPTEPPVTTFPPGCFIFNSCDQPSGGSGYKTILIWPISLVQQGYCGLGEECITTAGSGTSCTNHSCIYRGPAAITGSVFTDYNSNRIKDAGETDYSGEYTLDTSYTAGPYKPSNCPSTDFNTCKYSYGGSDEFCTQCAYYPANPAGSGSPQCNGGTYNSCVSTCTSDASSCPGVGPGYTAAQYCNAQCTQGAQCCGGSYGVCSSWWCGFKATCGTDCTGTFTPAPPPPVLSTNKSGSVYTVSGPGGGNIPYGTYTVTVSVASATFTEPTAGNSFTVIAGDVKTPPCSTGGSANASCYLGGIRNLNFGIKGNNPWYQTIGGDIRRDSGVSVQIPANASCGAYASLPGSGGSPGIIYSGSSSTSFGSGQASATNWVAGGVTYPETYSPTRPNLIRTSYNYLASVAKAAAITPIDISTYCSGGLNACTLPTNLPNGLYIANDNLTLTGSGYTFPANKNFVILVNGNLTIKEQIHVPGGSTATFSASGDITIDKSVGQSSSSSTAADVEGFFSADKNFIIDGNNDCAIAPDTRVNVAGAVVVNAALAGGTLQNNRNLCTGNDNCPAFSVAERADFVLNAPEFIKHPSYTYQESAP